MLAGICLLRTPPQELPASRLWMAGALAAYAVTDVIAVLDVLTPQSAVLAAAVDTLLLAAVTQLVLQWRRLENRTTQTLTALAGCGALLSLLSLLAWMAAGMARELVQPEWIWAAFLVWYSLVFGHVLRHALSISWPAGVGASLLYLLLSMGVTGTFLDPAPQAP